MPYFWQSPDWPAFHWKDEELAPLLSKVRHEQGRLLGRVEALGFKVRENALLQTLTQDVVKTSEIEGERLDEQQVRSSLARRLGIDIDGFVTPDRNVEGIVQITLDATMNCNEPLTAERLFSWHGALFPTGRNEWGQKLRVGAFRDDSTGPMQVVSGPIGREKVHYVAPPAAEIDKEMDAFLSWFSAPTESDPVLKAAVAHIWFVGIHPFDDGNGRITRAIADMALARADAGPQRLYSMSAEIGREKNGPNGYYAVLKKTTTGTSVDLTDWNRWFVECLDHAVASAMRTLDNVLVKSDFWQKHESANLNARQTKVLNRLLEGFEGKLTSTKWAKLTKTSQDTATRDIADLVEKGILRKGEAGGRSTNYELVIDGRSESAATASGEATEGDPDAEPARHATKPLLPAEMAVEAKKASIEASGWLAVELDKIVRIAESARQAMAQAEDRNLPEIERRRALGRAEDDGRAMTAAWTELQERSGPPVAARLAQRLAACGPFAQNYQAEFEKRWKRAPEIVQSLPAELAQLENRLTDEGQPQVRNPGSSMGM